MLLSYAARHKSPCELGGPNFAADVHSATKIKFPPHAKSFIFYSWQNWDFTHFSSFTVFLLLFTGVLDVFIVSMFHLPRNKQVLNEGDDAMFSHELQHHSLIHIRLNLTNCTHERHYLPRDFDGFSRDSQGKPLPFFHKVPLIHPKTYL